MCGVLASPGHQGQAGLTEAGPVEISVPRDRDSSFEPQIVAKRQRRLTGVEDLVISLSAKGLTHGEIAAYLQEVYGAEVPEHPAPGVQGGQVRRGGEGKLVQHGRRRVAG